MPKRNRAYRTMLAVVSAGLLVGGVYFTAGSYRWFAQVERSRESRPVSVAIDLSQPGKTAISFDQPAAIAQKQQLRILEGDDLLRAQPLVGLEGELVIHDDQGQEVLRADIGETRLRRLVDGKPSYVLKHFKPLPEGSYRLTVCVDRGIAPHEVREHTLESLYVVTGSEMLPGLIMGAIALACSAAGLMLGVVFLMDLWYHGIR